MSAVILPSVISGIVAAIREDTLHAYISIGLMTVGCLAVCAGMSLIPELLSRKKSGAENNESNKERC